MGSEGLHGAEAPYCKLLLFPVLEFISWNGKGGVGGWRWGFQGKRLSFSKRCLQIGKLLWCCLRCAGYWRLMWNFTANKNGQRVGENVRRSGPGCRLLEEEKGGGVIGIHLNLALCFCQSLFRIKLWELARELSPITNRWADRSSCYAFTSLPCYCRQVQI